MEANTEFWREAALPYVESRRACGSRACYKPHSHPTYSIGAVDQGCSVFTGAGGGAGADTVALRAGSLVFVPAGRVHACNPAPHSAWSYQMLHLDAAWLQALREESASVQQAPQPPWTSAEPVLIVNQPALYARFCTLNSLLFSTAEPQHKEAALIEFIGDCDLAHNYAHGALVAQEDAPEPELSARIAPALQHLRSEPAANTPLAVLAALAGLSRYQLIRAFRAATGLTPHAWQLNQRINLAREAIRAGEHSAALAHRLGFADQAHFQRVFKAYAGVTPGTYRP